MKKFMMAGFAVFAMSGCMYDADPFDQPLPNGQKYRLLVAVPGEGIVMHYESTESLCGRLRARILSENRNSALIENCKPADPE